MKTNTRISRCALCAAAAAFALGAPPFTASASDRDLDIEGVVLLMDIVGADKNSDDVYEVDLGSEHIYLHQLSRQPQPRNEWVFKDYTLEEWDPRAGMGGAWVEKKGGVDTDIVGTFRKEFRADLFFYATPGDTGPGTKHFMTPGTMMPHKVIKTW